MKCVIVAAGSSTRLRPLTDALPKCLLSIGGKTILQRAIENILDAHITKIAVVVGFQAQKIQSFLTRRYPHGNIQCILNPNFASTNNAYSLLLARDFFLESESRTKTNDRLLILDSDIVFHPGLLTLLNGNKDENALAVRVDGVHDGEEVRASIDKSGNISRIGKNIALDQALRESIGIELFTHVSARMLFEILEEHVRRGSGRTGYYESAFQEMIDKGTKIRAVDVGKLPVIEIDSKDDYEYAERVTVPSIDASLNVRVQ
jgi:choline kinase